MPQAYLPLYHYAFSTYSPVFADEIIHLLDDTLYSKSDLRFMESVYRVSRIMKYHSKDLFKYLCLHFIKRSHDDMSISIVNYFVEYSNIISYVFLIFKPQN